MRRSLTLTTPARGFLDSFLIGDGTTGAAIGGGVGTETFDLTHDTFWSGGPELTPLSADSSHVVDSVREAVRAGDGERADDLALGLQSQHRTQSFQPIGRLSWTYDEHPGAAEGYDRTLDLANATATTTYADDGRPRRLESFVSAVDGVLVSSARGSSGPTGPLAFDSLHATEVVVESGPDGVETLVATGRAPTHVSPDTLGDVAGAVRYDDRPSTGDGLADAGMAFAVVAQVRRTADGWQLIAAVETGFRGWHDRVGADPAPLVSRARERVERASSVDPHALRERHTTDYSELFDRVCLDLGEAGAVDELAFDLGRYLFISSSRPGGQAANLQGIWNVDVRPAWSSDFTLNINTPMNYWAAELVGLADLHEPLLRLTAELADAGRATARRTYGFDGSVAHHNTDLWRFTAPVAGRPMWSNWPSALPWLAAHTWMHLEFGSAPTGFAEHVALPVHRAATAFVLDALVEASDGSLVQSPSTSPENLFRTEAGRAAAVTAGSAMDRELAVELLEHFVTLVGTSGASGADEALALRAADALTRIARPTFGAAGIDEWSAGLTADDPGHRHLSHLYGLYPGTRITRERPDELAAATTSLHSRIREGSGYTGWSQAWILCLAARAGDAELAARSLSTLTGPLTSATLLDLHPHLGFPEGSVFQIDGNLGLVAGVVELLLQSHGDVVRLLPTLPGRWATGSATGLRARGGHTVSLAWRDGALTEAVITSGRTGVVRIDTGDTPVSVDGGATSTLTTIDATAGETYRLVADG